MSKQVSSLNELIEAVMGADPGQENQFKSDLTELAKNAQALQAENAQLRAELENAEAQNAILQEQVEALKAATEKAEAFAERARELSAQVETLQVQVASVQAENARVKLDAQLDKGLAGLVFDLNDSKRNERLAMLCKADWAAQFKVEERDGVLTVIDKKTQTASGESPAESIATFANANGYTVKPRAGLNIAGELNDVETVAITDLSYADADSEDPKRREAYIRRVSELGAEFQKNGGLLNSKAYFKMLEKHGLVDPNHRKLA